MYLLHPTRYVAAALLIIASLLLSACSGGDDPTTNQSGAVELPDAIFLAEAPEGIQTIAALKTSAKEGDKVVVRVAVGGTEKPIVEGRASAAIIDAHVDNPCLGDDDHCPTPWDYCCTPQENRTANLATLQISDEAGKVLKAELTPRIEPLTMLVIKGTVGPRPDAQVLTINATGIYIESDSE